MYLMYIDESGNTGTNYKDSNQPFFSMAGIIVKDSDWIQIDSELSQLKQELFGVDDIEIHASLMYNPKRGKNKTPFWANRTKEENWKSIEKIVDFMRKSELNLMITSFSKQNIKQYLGKDLKVDPYYLALIALSYHFDMFLEEKKQKGIVITDKIENIDEKITRIILDKLRFEKEYKINDIVERPLRTDSTMSNMVQLADVCVFFVNKYYSLKKNKNNNFDNLTSKEEYIVKMANKMKSMVYVNNNSNSKINVWIDKFKELVINEIILSGNELK